MGFNTTIVVLNDALSYIEKDRDFGRKLAAAIHHVSVRRPVEVPAEDGNGGFFMNAARVIETHPADETVTVEVGQNQGRVVK